MCLCVCVGVWGWLATALTDRTASWVFSDSPDKKLCKKKKKKNEKGNFLKFSIARHLDIKWRQIKSLNGGKGAHCALMCYYAVLSVAESDKISPGGECWVNHINHTHHCWIDVTLARLGVFRVFTLLLLNRGSSVLNRQGEIGLKKNCRVRVEITVFTLKIKISEKMSNSGQIPWSNMDGRQRVRCFVFLTGFLAL